MRRTVAELARRVHIAHGHDVGGDVGHHFSHVDRVAEVEDLGAYGKNGIDGEDGGVAAVVVNHDEMLVLHRIHDALAVIR